MAKVYQENKVFEKVDVLSIGEYDFCTFHNCNFASSDLSSFEFLECEFRNCDLNMVVLNDTAFKDVKFINCKLQGVDFQYCNSFLLSLGFEDCSLKLASFYKLQLKATVFSNCNLQEVDFVESNLMAAKFDNCDLNAAIFENTNLERADFNTAYNYSLDPALNKLQKAKFSIPDVVGLLAKFDIIVR